MKSYFLARHVQIRENSRDCFKSQILALVIVKYHPIPSLPRSQVCLSTLLSIPLPKKLGIANKQKDIS